MSAADIAVRVVSNCVLLATVLTFVPSFEPGRTRLLGRFFYIFVRYTIAPGLLLGIFYWLIFRHRPEV